MRDSLPEFYCGSTHSVHYPFSRDVYSAPPEEDGEMWSEKPTWRPGVINDCDNYGNTTTYADAMGVVTYTVIGVFKPASYPERIFYTRKWTDPDGKQFGKNKLRITTTQNFRKMLNGYRHDFEMGED